MKWSWEKCPRNSNHVHGPFHYSLNFDEIHWNVPESVVHSVLFHHWGYIPTIHMVGTRMMTDDDGIPTTRVVHLYIIEYNWINSTMCMVNCPRTGTLLLLTLPSIFVPFLSLTLRLFCSLFLLTASRVVNLTHCWKWYHTQARDSVPSSYSIWTFGPFKCYVMQQGWGERCQSVTKVYGSTMLALQEGGWVSNFQKKP